MGRLTTESRRLAAALAASEARYRHLVESAPDIIYRTDADGHFTFVNPIAEVIIGRSQAELLGTSYLDLIHPDDRDAMRRHYGRQWLRGTPTTYAEFRVCTQTRGDVWIGQNVQLVLEGDQRVGFQAIARDITDRKRAQEALARLQRQTESILNSAAEGILSSDRDGLLVMANKTAAELTGYSENELLGQRAHALLHHSRADGSAYPADECAINAALRSGSAQTRQHDVFWRRDGSSFPVEYTIVPVKEEGQITGAVLTFHDISDRIAIERMKDQFISVVSHELRTPLTSIRASLGLLGGGLLDLNSSQARRLIDLAINNSDRLIELINAIVDLQRLSTGDLAIERQSVDVCELVKRSVDEARTAADAADVRLDVECEAAAILGDMERLTQALANIVDNAIKFSPPGSRVFVNARAEQREVLISVRDSGRGIPEHKLQAIFGRFERADNSDAREGGGSGLGLALSRGIVELHGGRIWVESTQGEGSTFSLALPIRPEG